jgi:argonaute-like protein implicated in RNA metabolism and viral defense
LSGKEVLLWTQGNAPDIANGKDFYKEGKSIPRPILLKRYAGHGDLDQVCWEILGLTKMDWNNDSLYNRLPVTLSYAGVLARTLKRMPNLSPKPYALRFFM